MTRRAQYWGLLSRRAILARSVSALAIAAALAHVATPAQAQTIIDGGQIVTVPGSQSSPWAIGNLFVGDGGTGTLNIEDGGAVSSATGSVGLRSGSEGTVTVSGSGSVWNNSGAFFVGYSGTGTLTIADGGTVSNDFGNVGYSSGSEGTVTVSGATSTWTNSNELFVGDGGTGTLTIADGGTVSNWAGYVGFRSGSEGTVTVSGAGSTWTNSGDLTVGYSGTGTLTIADGGAVSNTAGYVGNQTGSEGTVTVSGEGSTWSNSHLLAVGFYGTGTLTIAGGGAVSNTSGIVGYVGGSNGTVTVSGAGSTWTNSGDLYVGLYGTGTLTIENGGAVSNTSGLVGSSSEVTVSGAGSTWTNSGDLTVGYSGTGTLIIADGGKVSSSSGYVGDETGSEGTVTVSGEGSTWTNSAGLYVGSAGTGTLTIADSGVATSDFLIMALEPGSSGTLRLEGGAGGSGVLAAGQVSRGDGDASIVFDGGTLRLTAQQSNLFYGFAAGDISLAAGGAVIDTNGFDATTSAVLSGAGGLTKTGTGTLTLAGNNTYTGTTTILDGRLVIAGSLAGAVEARGGQLTVADTASFTGTLDISAGGKVGGNGTLGTVNVGSGGILSPGNSIGAVTIATLNVGAGSFYDVEIINGGNTPGVHNDLINVTGVATFSDGLTIRVTPENGTDTGSNYAIGTVYTILTTTNPGDLVFSGALDVTDTFAFLNFKGSHNSQNMYLTSELAATTFCQTGSGANQCGAGNAAFQLGTGNGVFDAMVGLGQNEVAAALGAISGEAHASVQNVVDQSFAQLDDMLTRRGSDGLAALKTAMAPLGYAAQAEGPGVAAIDSAMLSPVSASAWLTPLGGRGQVSADANAAALDYWQGGLAGGYEMAREGALGGFAFGYQRGSASVAARQSQSTFDSLMLGTYGALTDGTRSIAGALTVGTSRVSTARTISVGNVTNTANADYWTQSIGLSLEATHDFDLGNGTTLSPLATLGLGWSGHGGFTETGAGAFNLTAAASGAIHLDAGLGLALSHVIETETGTMTLSGRAVWEHSFAAASIQSMRFAGGNTPFTVQGPDAGRDRLHFGAGLAFDLDEGITMGLDYGGTFSASQQAHKASAFIGVQF